MDPDGPVGPGVVFDGELALRVRTEIGHFDAGVADLTKHLQYPVAQVQREGHILIGLAAGIAEHNSLVSGTLEFRVLALDALVDVSALLVNRGQDAAGRCLEHIFGLVVAYSPDGIADDGLDINVGFGLDLTHHHNGAGRAECLARNLRLGVAAQEFIQDGIADLVRDFVGMSLGHRFRREEVSFHNLNTRSGPFRGGRPAP